MAGMSSKRLQKELAKVCNRIRGAGDMAEHERRI